MKRMNAQVHKMEKRLHLWRAKLDATVEGAAESGIEMQSDYQRRVDDLIAKYAEAKSNVDKMGAAGIDKWKTFTVEVEKSWKVFETDFMALTSSVQERG